MTQSNMSRTGDYQAASRVSSQRCEYEQKPISIQRYENGRGKWLSLKLGKFMRLWTPLRSADNPVLEAECNSLHGFCQEAQRNSPGKSDR